MKLLFAGIAAVLVVCGVLTWASFPEQDERPVLYWVTDNSPSRPAHAAGFEQWMREEGRVGADGEPLARAAIDANNGGRDKIIIQGVAGVASDLVDVHGGDMMRLFRQTGILRDVTGAARTLGFGPGETWEAIRSEIMYDGRQYMFPANVSVRLLWVNKRLFERLGVPLPPRHWTFDEFEALGMQFVDTANPRLASGDRQTVFFCDDIPTEALYRSTGLSMFNETMTACDLDDPRYAAVLERRHRWIYELGLMPSPEDRSSLSAQAGWGGLAPQLFTRDKLGMLHSGRYMLLQFRQFARETGQALELQVVGNPHGGFPTARAAARGVAIYTGSERPELAELFPAYLAGQRYNEMIVEDADALPPNPRFTRTEAFNRPPEWPNEWGTHERFVEAMETIAVGGAYSPFVLTDEADRERLRFEEEFDNGLITSEQAARRTAERINARIARTVRDDPELRRRYEELVERQRLIDERFAAGEPVPAEWIENPFYRHYYGAMGLLSHDAADASVEVGS